MTSPENRPVGLAKVLRAITRKGAAVASQGLGAVAVVVAVGLLAGGAWALLAAGLAVVAAGTLAETS